MQNEMNALQKELNEIKKENEQLNLKNETLSQENLKMTKQNEVNLNDLMREFINLKKKLELKGGNDVQWLLFQEFK